MTTPEFLNIEHSKLAARLRRHRTLLLVSFDVAALLASYAIFAWARYDGLTTPPWGHVFGLAALAVAVHLALGFGAKLYRGRSTVASTDETLYLCIIVMVACVLAQAVNLTASMQMVARGLPVGAGFMALAMMLFARAQWRRYAHTARYVVKEEGHRTVIVGAGEAGRQLVGSMLRSHANPFIPVAFIDDDPLKRHLRIEGIAVRGTLADLETVLRRYDADQVVVAIPSAPSETFREISSRGTAAGVDVKVLPPVDEFLGDRVSIRDVRDINVADLLGRGPIETDIAAIAGFLNNKRVLVTGAGGSIGSELCRQISKWHPAELMMLDRDESALHGVQLSITGQALLDSDDVILADIRDLDALERIFAERRPEVVFHAAALKHLPMLEQYPVEAIKTNVLGTANVLEVAERFGVERVVNISTDKAADPTSILGYSKRVAERITADFARRGAGTYMSVRFGNVLGSRGSVLTTFAAQIAQGGPITVTHPDVTRYFMTVAEAVQLVLQAGAIGRDGEVMILDMGEPVRIDDVARQLVAQSGRDIEIVYTGLRDGEKLDEILIGGAEADERPIHDLISHVQVSPLPMSALAQAEVDVEPELAPTMLREWCLQDATAQEQAAFSRPEIPAPRGEEAFRG